MRIHDYLTKEEIKALLKKSDARGALQVASTWAIIAGSLALAAIWPHPLTIIVAMILIGGRQLALAILMHDASHRAIFETRSLNDFAGRWLAAYPIFHDFDRYRPYHLQHHNHTGTDRDPDLKLAKMWPVPPKVMGKRVAKDLSGQTGLRAHLGLLLMHFDYIRYNLGGVVEWIDQRKRSLIDTLKTGGKRLWGPILCQLILLGIFWLVGAPWLYLVWIGAMLTFNMLFLRIRSIAEHSVVPDQSDPMLNTRTTRANILERLTVAPHHVNYHMEHHLLMSAPSYNLPKMHRLLVERGFFEKAPLAQNYREVLRLAVLKQPAG